MDVYTVYKYQIDWELTPFSFLRGGTFAWGSLMLRFKPFYLAQHPPHLYFLSNT